VTEGPEETVILSEPNLEEEIPAKSILTNVVEAAEEFAEKMTGIEDGGEAEKPEETKLTMEERKAKIEQLRQKMVRSHIVIQIDPLLILVPSNLRGPRHLPTGRP
jgi:hypothetical protein